ncbi:energy-coupling factor transporter transmembrane protein EcfT, partial [Streptococcus suis]
FGFLLMIFWANNLVTNAFLIAFVLGMVVLSRIRLSFFINGLKQMIGIILFTTFFQVFFTPGATILWEFWIFKLSVEGLQQEAI